MSKLGSILIIDDDQDDKEILSSILEDLGVERRIEWFLDTGTAFNYLKTTNDKIFLIFCDVNLPGQNGLEFKLRIDMNPELRKKSVPFIFFSTNARQREVDEAYSTMTVQGFFRKGTNYGEMKEQIDIIMKYWSFCKHPNN